MIGMILKNMRLSNKMSQATLSEKMSVADTTISSYERENSQPDFETILKITRICGFDILIKNKDGNIVTVEEMSKEMDF